MSAAEAASVEERPTRTSRRSAKWAFLSLILLTIALNVYPIRTGSIRLALAALPLILLVQGSMLLLRPSLAILTVVVVGTSALAIAVAPGNTADPSALSAAYIGCLKRYEGAKYVWGGETNRGIDCSGLVRCGLMDAYLHEGIQPVRCPHDPAGYRPLVERCERTRAAARLRRSSSGRNSTNDDQSSRLLVAAAR